MNNKELGNFGETQACWLLKEKGYHILERNWRCPVGEIDIVARRGSMVVFVEVKTRRSLTYGVPREAVTSKKTTANQEDRLVLYGFTSFENLRYVM